ncbi:putative membrane protein YphA (DoxX/SURF4 family) [Streptacidiphilus sp. MAP12-20]|uniref:TQO small subunit DoxD n=1 Tax=Streptacidiphilus sp. MAP12-20 TaxID=3156299 RepID=UPI0035126DAA
MDTRTRTRPRPEAANAGGIDGGEPMLNTVKVPSDPTRLNTTTASFRVRFTPPAASLIDAGPVRAGAAFGAGAGMREPVLVGAMAGAMPVGLAPGLGAGTGGVGAMPRRRGRVVPITWTGQLDLAVPGAPGMPGVPAQGQGRAAEELESTQQMSLADFEELDAYEDFDDVRVFDPPARRPPLPDASDGVAAAQHHAWYPGKRVDLGLVLLPLRVFLGCFSLYAGFSKLCDPVYFNGGARGSMMHWLEALHPWSVAQPLLALAMAHPVGAGLAVAFVQINVGVLAILGLWQRLCAAVAMLLAFALLVTVSWQTVPAYDTPEIIYLAAWSPLLLAGAPLFSLDGWLHLEAWRRLGEHARVTQLRRRVVRRGVVVATVVIGGTLLLGSVLGAAVRASHLTATTTVPSEAPSATPTQPLPLGAWPTGVVPVPTGTGPQGSGWPAPAASKPAASPSGTPHRHRGSSTGHGTTGGTGGSSGSTAPPSHSNNPAPAPSATGPKGVIGGLLGG